MLLNYDAKGDSTNELKEYDLEWQDEHIEGAFSNVVLELLSPDREDIIPQDEYSIFIDILKEQSHQMVDTGQYKKLHQTIRVLESNIEKHNMSGEASNLIKYFCSDKFISRLIESFSIMGRELRDEVFMLCDYYGDRIIPSLMKALINEESPSVRRFMLNLLTGFGDKVIPDTVKGLEDDRWFVKRNMLFILMDCGNEAALKNARPCCDHNNPKVSFEAIKCLLKAGDEYGVTALRKYLNAESKELVNKAVILAGAYRVRNMVPDLLRILSKKALRGSDIEEKIPVVRALGQIGDHRAVGPLKRILLARGFLFKRSLVKLKEEIQCSLGNYSLDEAKKAGDK
jgi:hypothetical protein